MIKNKICKYTINGKKFKTKEGLIITADVVKSVKKIEGFEKFNFNDYILFYIKDNLPYEVDIDGILFRWPTKKINFYALYRYT